jgi:methionyl-tRNA formyltransferase
VNVVFFGTPQFAVPTLTHLLASRHEVRGVVTQPDRPRGRGQQVTDGPVKALAVAAGVPVLQPERLRDPAVAAALTAWQPDLGVVAAYGQIVPDSLLAIPRFGMINVHPSLLPKYRGAAPVHRAVIAGDAMTGVTIMRVVKALDSGPTFARELRPIGPDETSDVVESDLAERGAALLAAVVDQIATGTAHEEPQDESQAVYAPRLTKEEGLVDWTLPAAEIHDRVRGLYPWPHAYTYTETGARLILMRTRVAADGDTVPPGTLVDVGRDAVVVAAGGGTRLSILELQPEGRRPMPVRDFLAGRPLARGTRLVRP